ncbi:imidazole glycerol phosphate synthase subunit HisH [soil metagenome]
MRLAILDYGMGNLRSVEKAFEKVDVEVVRTSDAEVANSADGLVLPGVGAFPRAMARIRELGFEELITNRAAEGTPIMGICLGMQLLLSSSSELGGSSGLGLIKGEVSELQAGELKVPHIGWSPAAWTRSEPLMEGMGEDEPFYFVHSFVARPAEDADVLATAEHGETFACAISRTNIFGAQFHPEKSSAAGLRLLRNFASICEGVPA